MSQEQWNEKQRIKRQKEFAPPTSYKKDEIEIAETDNSGLYFTSKKPKFSKETPGKGAPIKFEYSIDEEAAPTPQPRGQGTEIPPPPSYDNSAKPKAKKLEMADAIEAGLNFLRSEAEKKTARKLKACFEI